MSSLVYGILFLMHWPLSSSSVGTVLGHSLTNLRTRGSFHRLSSRRLVSFMSPWGSWLSWRWSDCKFDSFVSSLGKNCSWFPQSMSAEKEESWPSSCRGKVGEPVTTQVQEGKSVGGKTMQVVNYGGIISRT